MATEDVPGANPANGDKLHLGCWAEHSDGSLILVMGAENSRIIYHIFDMSKSDDIVEYRDAMPEVNFKKQFTQIGWLWHDKSPFPWDRVIKSGARDRGMLRPSAEATLSAAERVARSLNLRASNTYSRKDNLEDLRSMVRELQDRLDSLGDDAAR